MIYKHIQDNSKFVYRFACISILHYFGCVYIEYGHLSYFTKDFNAELCIRNASASGTASQCSTMYLYRHRPSATLQL